MPRRKGDSRTAADFAVDDVPRREALIAQACAEYAQGCFPSYRQAAKSILEACYPRGVGTPAQEESKVNYLSDKISELYQRSRVRS